MGIDSSARSAPTHRQRRRRRRRRTWITLALIAGLLLGSLGGGAFEYVSVRDQVNRLQGTLALHLQRGQSYLEDAKTSLKKANATHDVNLVNRATVDFISAKIEFTTTRQIADNSELVRQAEGLPEVGDQARRRHSAVDAIADMGSYICDGGIELSKIAGQLIAPPASGQAGRTLLNAIDEANAGLNRVRADIQRANAAAESVDVRLIPDAQFPAFMKARASITSALTAIDEFQAFIPFMKELLGGNGARTYLIEQVNPAELRPGGGFIGTYSVIRADNGSLKLLGSGDAYDLADPRPVIGQAGYVAPPGPFRQLIGITSWSFVDSNFYADFPSNAVAAENFAQSRLGTTINGVISLDYYTVAKLLELTGPLRVPGYGTTIDSNNFVPIVMGNSLAQNSINKPILHAIAGPLMERIAAIGPDQWPTLLAILNELANQRHLQVYFNSDQVESQVSDFGWSGLLNPTASYDFMAEVEANVGGTKANYFLTRKYSIVLTRQGNVLHHQVVVDLLNDTPYVYRPDDFYRVYVRLVLPASISQSTDNLKHDQYGDPVAPPGMKQLMGFASMPGYGHGAKLVFQYDTLWGGNSRGMHMLYWQKQPGTLADRVDVAWNDGFGNSFATNGILSQDVVVILSPSGVSLARGQAASGHLPSLSLG